MNYGDQVAPVELDVSSSMCRASRARVERVELCSSTSSTQPKCMGSTRRMCRVESSQVEFEPYIYFCVFIISNSCRSLEQLCLLFAQFFKHI